MPSMTTEQSIAIYDILMQVCGASADQRGAFIQSMTGPNPPAKWHFGGLLGAGGILYVHEMRVDYSIIDHSKERSAIAAKANQRLRWQAPMMIDFAAGASRSKAISVKYLPGVNKQVDEALALAEIDIQPGDSWWHIHDALISSGMEDIAAVAQRHATPSIDLISRLQAELVAAKAAAVRRSSAQ